MLKEKAIGEFFEIRRLVVNFGASVILWNCKWTIRKRILYFCAFYTSLVYYTVDVCYLTVTYYNLLLDLSTSLDILVKVFMHWFSRLIGLLFQYHGIWYKSELQLYCTRVLDLHRKLRRKAIKNLAY